jgi:(2Fe-2S) ferredoxin
VSAPADDGGHCSPQPFEPAEFRVLDELRYHVFVCTDAGDFCGCDAAGSRALLTALRQEVARRRLTARCKITIMHCRQPGAAGPSLVVHPDGLWYEGLTAGTVPEFVEMQLVQGTPLARYLRRQAPQGVTAVPLHLARDT